MDYIVRRDQNIFDIAIQLFGDISFAAQIINDNDLTWSAPLTTGQVLQINNVGVGNEEIKTFFELSGRIVQNITPALTGEDDLTFSSTVITWDSTEITFDNDVNAL